jgi:hypothetical protein
MAVFLVEYFKLIVFFTFVAFMIVLSHLSAKNAKPARRKARRRSGIPVPAGR